MSDWIWKALAAGAVALVVFGLMIYGCNSGGGSGGGSPPPPVSATPTPTTTPSPTPTLTIATASLPDGLVGQSYSSSLQATGGSGTVSWSVSSGSLPSGVNLNASGVLSGMPTAAATASFTVMAQDASSPPQQVQRSLTLTVQPASSGGGGGGGGSTVTLTVVNQFGTPLSGATVWIDGLAAQTTNGSGQASFSGVTLPYTVNASVTGLATAGVNHYQTVTLVESRRTAPVLRVSNHPAAAQLVQLSGSIAGGTMMTSVDGNLTVSPHDQAYDAFANPAFSIYAAPDKDIYVAAINQGGGGIDDGAIAGPFNGAAGSAQAVNLTYVGIANLASISGTVTLPAALSAAANSGPGVYAHYGPVDSLQSGVWIGAGGASGSGTARTYTVKYVPPIGTPPKAVVTTFFNGTNDGWAGAQLPFTTTGPALTLDDGPISITAPATGAGFLANPVISWTAPAAGADATYVTVSQQGAGYQREWQILLPPSRSTHTLGAHPAGLTNHPLQNGAPTSVRVVNYDFAGFSGYDSFDFGAWPLEYGTGGGKRSITPTP